MTIQELIDKLNKVEDKTINIEFQFINGPSSYGDPVEPFVYIIGNSVIISNSSLVFVMSKMADTVLKQYKSDK